MRERGGRPVDIPQRYEKVSYTSKRLSEQPSGTLRGVLVDEGREHGIRRRGEGKEEYPLPSTLNV